ncbi:MAG: TerB family tellurite resistance protein [Gammaproteobacteria bacterium]|nr:TerB family tellurite resistance protein [Gammaproteobacteria bacterium]MCY4095895.1 TerB family tellurite resistance protein [Gammaproteobacteria bacterium]
MIRSSLSAIFKLFDETSGSAEEVEELYNETVLMTLSRATSVDSNIHPAEIGLVRDIVCELTGQEVTDGDIRVAANSHIYEEGSLSRYLNAVSIRIPVERKIALINALANIIKADQRITEREVFFFNMVVDDLNLHASDLVGLKQTQAF